MVRFLQYNRIFSNHCYVADTFAVYSKQVQVRTESLSVFFQSLPGLNWLISFLCVRVLRIYKYTTVIKLGNIRVLLIPID